jgi:hypothetical protein
MERSPSREAISCVATRLFPSILWNPMVHYQVHETSLFIDRIITLNPISRMSSSGLCRRVGLVTYRLHLQGENNGLNKLAVASDSSTLQLQCRFLQEPHGDTSQKTAFFILTAV